MYFYGAGKKGELAYKMLSRYAEADLLEGFMESDPKQEYKDGYKIASLPDVDKTAEIVITIANTLVVCEIYDKLMNAGYRNVYYYLDRYIDGKNFLEGSCISCMNWGDSCLAQAEIHVCDFCNLNCRGCTHYSPIFEHEYPDTEKRIQDIRDLSKKFSHIIYFYLLGGEPFLNPDIITYIKKTRELLPNSILTIVSNGLLIPKLPRDVFEALVECDYVVSISEYEPTHRIIKQIEKTLHQYGVQYNIRSYDKKQKFNKPLSISADSERKKLCISNGCVNIYNGKIARCPSIMYVNELNNRFGISLPNEGIYPLDNTYSAEELKELLKKEVALCAHCVENAIEWKSCGKTAELSDFVEIENP